MAVARRRVQGRAIGFDNDRLTQNERIDLVVGEQDLVLMICLALRYVLPGAADEKVSVQVQHVGLGRPAIRIGREISGPSPPARILG